jgi:GT2 family glycosyltransferase
MSDCLAESVAVVIVNRNAGRYLPRCLSCLAAQQSLPARIVVFDNGSDDGSIAAARQAVRQDDRLAGRVVFHLAGENLGFAAANNRAVAMCGAELPPVEFIALVNPDAFPEPGWLAALLAAARQHPECAAFGSRQLLADKPGMLDGVGDVYHVSGLSWRAGHGCPVTAADERDAEIFSPCAAAALYRKSAFDAVGGFDEDFFCYFEDVDLGFRLRLAGYQARYVAGAVVEHVCGASARAAGADFAVFHGHRNLVWCYVKNMPGMLLLGCLPAHLFQTAVVLLCALARGEARAIMAAKAQAVAGLRRCWRKRRLVQAGSRASVAAIWRSLDKSIFRRRTRPLRSKPARSES